MKLAPVPKAGYVYIMHVILTLQHSNLSPIAYQDLRHEVISQVPRHLSVSGDWEAQASSSRGPGVVNVVGAPEYLSEPLLSSLQRLAETYGADLNRHTS